VEPIDRHPRSLEPDDAALDTLLAQARWPEPSPASTQRLQRAWRRNWPARNVRLAYFAAAAVVVLSAGIALLLSLRDSHQAGIPSIAVAPVPGVPPAELRAPIAESKLYVADSREPTARERMAMCDISHRKRSRAKNPPARSTPPAPVAVPNLRWPPSTAASSQSRPASDGNSRIEDLLAELSSPRIAARYAAVRELARIDGPATTSMLIDLVEQNIHRREALAALLLCAANNDELARTYLADARESRGMEALVRSAEMQLKTF
jgi:hypothetical protein